MYIEINYFHPYHPRALSILHGRKYYNINRKLLRKHSAFFAQKPGASIGLNMEQSSFKTII